MTTFTIEPPPLQKAEIELPSLTSTTVTQDAYAFVFDLRRRVPPKRSLVRGETDRRELNIDNVPGRGEENPAAVPATIRAPGPAPLQVARAAGPWSYFNSS